MVRDEFNKIEITNDKQLRGIEFGKTQKVEFTAKKENEIPEGDLNEKFVGKTIKKVTEVNVDYIQKIPTHSTTTVIQSAATTATSAAAAAASTVVAASTVAVVAIATVTGISVALHDYHCELTSLFISSNEITYSMSIVDEKRDDGAEYQSYEENPRPRYSIRNVGEDTGEPITENPNADEPSSEDDYLGIYDSKRPFVLTVSNGYYEASHYLDYGNSKEQTFSGLTLGDTYKIVLKENRYGGEVLYDEAFTTAPNSGFRDFYLSGEADFRRNTIGVYLDYIDELECLSEFTITFTDKENSDIKYIVPLENMQGYQDAEVLVYEQSDMGFDFEKEYTYTFSYMKNEEVIEYRSGDITFYNTSTYVSQVYGVSWDHKANFLTNETTIALDYQDDYEIYSDFKFVLTPEEQDATSGGDPLVYELAKTTEPQNINLYENQYFNYVSTYSYMFTYMEQGKDVEQIIESDSGLRFEDNSGTVVNGVSWDKTINLLTKEFTLTLDYVDDEVYQRFTDFQLTLKDEEMPEEMYDEPYDLGRTTDEQTVTISEDSNLRLRKPMLYSFTYSDKLDNSVHVLEEGTVTFTDISNGQKQFNGININPTPDMVNNTIEVQLDYVDDFNELYSFTLTLSAEGETPISIYLDSTTEKQTIDVSSYSIDFTKTYDYAVTYYDDATWEEESPSSGKGTITFNHSVFNEFIFDKTADFASRAFNVQLDFVDGLNIYSNFELVISDEDDNTETFTLEKTTSEQTLFLNQMVTEEFDGEINEHYKFSMGGTFNYTFSYHDSFLDEDVTIGPETFIFTNTQVSTFTNIVSSFDFTTEESSGQSYLLPMRFEYDDAADIYSGFDIQICVDDEPVTSLRFEGDTDTKDWIYGVLVLDGLDINDLVNADNTSIKVVASLDVSSNLYLEDEYEREVYEKDVAFTLDEHKEIFGGRITYDHITWGGDIGFQIVYSGHSDDFVDCQLVLEGESGTIYRFAIAQLSPGNNYCTIYMSSDNLGPDISEEDFIHDFINYPMKVSITYYKRVPSTSPTGGDEKDGPYTVLLHEQFDFEESV